QGNQRVGDQRSPGSGSLSPGAGKTASRRQGKHRYLERMRRLLHARLRARVRIARYSLRHPVRRKFLQRPAPRRSRTLAQIRNCRDQPGAVVVFFRDIPELADKPCIIRKRDGGFNYATTDIATVDYRLDDLKADSVWYVVGAPQTLHFKQIFEIARRQGYQADLRHITFGSIL